MMPPLQHDPVAQAHANWAQHGWGESADTMAAVTSLFRVQQILMARIDAVLRPLDLTFARLEMLTLLGFSRTGSMPLAKASARLQVHPTSVTHTVERLGQAGLVERRPHPTDGRANLIAITPQGRDLALQAARELNREVFTDLGLPAGDVAELNRILGTLRFTAGDFAEPSTLMGGPGVRPRTEPSGGSAATGRGDAGQARGTARVPEDAGAEGAGVVPGVRGGEAMPEEVEGTGGREPAGQSGAEGTRAREARPVLPRRRRLPRIPEA